MKEFEERTGIYDESVDFNMENLKAKMQYDMVMMRKEDPKRLKE